MAFGSGSARAPLLSLAGAALLAGSLLWLAGTAVSEPGDGGSGAGGETGDRPPEAAALAGPVEKAEDGPARPRRAPAGEAAEGALLVTVHASPAWRAGESVRLELAQLPGLPEGGWRDVHDVAGRAAERTARARIGEAVRIEGLAPGGWELRAWQPGDSGLVTERRPVEVPAGGLAEAVLLAQTTGIQGTVRSAWGEPLAGVPVTLLAGAPVPPEVRRVAVTGKDGSFRFGEAVWPGRLALKAASIEGWLGTGSGEFELVLGEVREVHLVMKRAHLVTGTVLGADGAPAAGAVVFLRSATQDLQTEAGADGSFAFDGVESAAPLDLYARTGGLQGHDDSARWTGSLREEDPRLEVLLSLAPSFQVAGRLRSSNPELVLGGREVALVSLDPARVRRVGRSRADGFFEVKGLYAGTYEAIVDGIPVTGAVVRANTRGRSVTVGADRPAPFLDLDLGPAWRRRYADRAAEQGSQLPAHKDGGG